MAVFRHNTHKMLPVLALLFAAAQAQNAANPFPDLSTETSVIGSTATTAATSAPATSAATSAASTAATSAASTAATAATTASNTVSNTATVTTGFPTISGVGVPALIVPDTSAASYMQKSSLPEGTVFIAVGAILGFLGACILAWHAAVAYSIHRSVQRAAATTHGPDAKSLFGLGASGPTYHSMYDASDLSLEALGKHKTAYAGPGADRSPSRPRGSDRRRARQQPSQSNLFFSPTAAQSGASTARNSQHLPSGFYAAAAAQPAAAGYGRMPSMDGASTLAGSRPASRPASRHMRPGSSGNPFAAGAHDPQRRSRLNPDTGGASHSPGPSQSQGHARTGSQTRAPSQYMEDLFSEHGYGPRERF